MPQKNVEAVREIYAEWARGNMKAGADLFDPEIVFKAFTTEGSIVATGPAEVEAFMRDFLTQWRDYRLFGEEFRAVEEDTVCVRGRQTGTGRGSGVAVELSMCSVWEFRDGAVVRLIFESEWEIALEAAGLQE